MKRYGTRFRQLQVYRMECENHLEYSLMGQWRLFSRKLAALALVLTLFSTFFANPAKAQDRLVCDPATVPALGAPLMTPACLTVAPVTAVFPPGTTAPPAGASLDAVSAPLVPAGDQSTVFDPCYWNPGFCQPGTVNQYGLTPTPPTTIGSSYPAAPFYGVSIQPGWRPCYPGLFPCGSGSYQSQPASSFDGGNATLPSIIASQSLAPYGMRRNVCWDGGLPWPGYYACGGAFSYGFSKPVDPIVFVPDGRAYMWPIGTNVISGGTQSTLTQQGMATCNSTSCTQHPCTGWLPGGFCTSWNLLGNCNGYSGTCIAWDVSDAACLNAVCTAWNPAETTVTIGAGDIVMPPQTCPPPPAPGDPDPGPCVSAYDIGCPPGVDPITGLPIYYVARQYDGVGGFTCLTMNDYMAAIPPVCDVTVDPTCTGGVTVCPAGEVAQITPVIVAGVVVSTTTTCVPAPPGGCVGPSCMPGPGSGLLPGICDSSSYFSAFLGWLSGAITGIDPCNLTMDQLGLSDSDGNDVSGTEGGEQFADYLEDWWFDTMLPDTRDMTTQWSVAILDQSLSLGEFMNSGNQVEHQLKAMQANEDKNLARLKPSENTCSMASIAPGMQRALQTTRAVKSALLQESASRALNLPGSGTESGRRVVHNDRWSDYCNIFADPTDNVGITNGCAGAVADLQGADINVERFLFRDTIDLSDANERAAADALLQNLVDYWVTEPLYPASENTAQLERMMARRNHYAALRQAVVEPVAGIISRRAAIPVPGGGYGMSVQAMRLAAGVPPALIHGAPSYNEALLARSKEYFMNLDTLLKSNVDVGPLRQDQVVNEALIAIILEDIAEVEGQINTILAARMSMKLNTDEDKLRKDFESLRPD